MLWGFIAPLRAGRDAESAPAARAGWSAHAIAYYQDFVRADEALPRARPSGAGGAGGPAGTAADALPAEPDAEAIQDEVYEVGKRHAVRRACATGSRCLYEVLLGQQEGPRFGAFVALYGIPETSALIEAALAAPGETPPPMSLVAAGRCGWLRRHGPAVFGVVLLVGALYVVQKEFRSLSVADIRDGAWATLPSPRSGSAAGWTVVAYVVLAVYDKLGSIYAGQPVVLAEVACSPPSAATRWRTTWASPRCRGRRCATGSTPPGG